MTTNTPVRPPAFILNAWYVAAGAGEVGAEALFARRLLDRPVLIYRTANGDPVALLDRCPHRFAYLSQGRRIGDQIECLYHGLRFGPDGACTRSPYQKAPPARALVQTFPVVERHRMIWIWMGDPALADPALIPDHSHLDRAQMRPLVWHVEFAGNWQIGNDNLMELTHLFWLHTSTIGGWKADAGATPGEKYTARVEDGKVLSRTFVPNIQRPPVFYNGLPEDQPFDQWTDTEWVAPANMRFTMGAVPAGASAVTERPYMVQSHCITPQTATSSHYFSGLARIFQLEGGPEVDERLIAFFKGIFDREDGPMMAQVQAQMGDADLLDLDPLILPRDSGAILARRLVAEQLAQEAGQAVRPMA
jgi:vanillate O-demethylase monooxygenase subunit